MRMAASPPEVIPLPSRLLQAPSESAKISSFWNPSPIQNPTPATMPLR